MDVNKIKTYLKDIYTELVEKTSWPSFPELRRESMVVLVATVLFSLVVYVMDVGLTRVMDLIYNL